MKEFKHIVLKNLKVAIEILEHEKIPPNKWYWGGGTLIYWLYKHRISKDIDIFLVDPQLLGLLTPRLNTWIEELVSDYSEGPTFIKLKLKDFEIDYIVVRRLTDMPLLKIKILSRIIFGDHPVEIISKKIFYKGFSLKMRDIVDISIVYQKLDFLPKVLGSLKLIPEPAEYVFKNLRHLREQAAGDPKLLLHIEKAEDLIKEAYAIQRSR